MNTPRTDTERLYWLSRRGAQLVPPKGERARYKLCVYAPNKDHIGWKWFEGDSIQEAVDSAMDTLPRLPTEPPA